MCMASVANQRIQGSLEGRWSMYATAAATMCQGMHTCMVSSCKAADVTPMAHGNGAGECCRT